MKLCSELLFPFLLLLSEYIHFSVSCTKTKSLSSVETARLCQESSFSLVYV